MKSSSINTIQKIVVFKIIKKILKIFKKSIDTIKVFRHNTYIE